MNLRPRNPLPLIVALVTMLLAPALAPGATAPLSRNPQRGAQLPIAASSQADPTLSPDLHQGYASAYGAVASESLLGPITDMVLAVQDAVGQVTWALADHNGTVRDLLDDSGALVNHVTYDSFGNMTGQTAPGEAIRYGFTGREYDAESGLYYYRSRYYDPTTGSFISEDSFGFAADDLNLYRYVFNAPVALRDPTGHEVADIDVPIYGYDQGGNEVSTLDEGMSDYDYNRYKLELAYAQEQQDKQLERMNREYHGFDDYVMYAMEDTKEATGLSPDTFELEGSVGVGFGVEMGDASADISVDAWKTGREYSRAPDGTLVVDYSFKGGLTPGVEIGAFSASTGVNVFESHVVYEGDTVTLTHLYGPHYSSSGGIGPFGLEFDSFHAFGGKVTFTIDEWKSMPYWQRALAYYPLVGGFIAGKGDPQWTGVADTKVNFVTSKGIGGHFFAGGGVDATGKWTLIQFY